MNAMTSPAEKSGTVTGRAVEGGAADGGVVAGTEPGVDGGVASVVAVGAVDAVSSGPLVAGAVASSWAKSSSRRSWAWAYSSPVPHSW